MTCRAAPQIHDGLTRTQTSVRHRPWQPSRLVERRLVDGTGLVEHGQQLCHLDLLVDRSSREVGRQLCIDRGSRLDWWSDVLSTAAASSNSNTSSASTVKAVLIGPALRYWRRRPVEDHTYIVDKRRAEVRKR
jgi:hypothetical protein